VVDDAGSPEARRDGAGPLSGNGALPATVAGDPTTASTVLSSRPVEGGAPPASGPQRLGRYRLIERLGVGGMAEVYLAEQAGAAGFQKKVVVKRILPHLAANRQFVEMFAREARVAARLSHPCVVQIFELGEEAGEFFIAMEHIDGLTLHRLAVAAWEQQRPLPLDVIARTLADVAVGLHAAHTLCDDDGKPLRLVHRDVSPDNLMVSKDGVTKVLDFGIAKGDLGGPQTKTGNLRGKIPFMPPEQIRGEPLDGRADLYALGVSAYWMLTGQRPFDRQSDWHTMQAIITEAAPPPSSLNSAVPAAVDALVLRLLDKDRDRRPATGRDVADELEALTSPASIGGKKTTVAFLAQLLPTTTARANPLSEQKPAASAAVEQRPEPAPLAPPAAPAPVAYGGAPAHRAAATPAPVTSMGAVAAAAAPLAPRVPAVADDEPAAVVRPVTTPSTQNAFSNLLAPRAPTGPSIGLRLGAFVGAAAIVLGLAVVVWRVVGPPKGAGHAAVDAGTPVSDAGVVAVDAGTTTAVTPPKPEPPPPPPTTPAPATVTVTARRAPSRIRWRAGDVVVGVGEGPLTIPADARSLRADDLRRHVEHSVPIVDGVVDYGALPTGTVIVVRVGPGVHVKIGDDDVSVHRKLVLVAGAYRFRVERGATVKEVNVEVAPGRTFTLDAAR
jgi:serine/threonine-protein kinase